MVDKEVAVTVLISKVVTVHIPTILVPIEGAFSVALADEVAHVLDSFCVIISWHKMCYCSHQYP